MKIKAKIHYLISFLIGAFSSYSDAQPMCRHLFLEELRTSQLTQQANLINKESNETFQFKPLSIYNRQIVYNIDAIQAKKRYLARQEFLPFDSVVEAQKWADHFEIKLVGSLKSLHGDIRLSILNLILAEAHKIPPIVVEVVTGHGGVIEITHSNVTEHPMKADLKGKVVERWRNGKTYETCNGLAAGLSAIVSVSYSRGGIATISHAGSQNVVLHEYGHIFDKLVRDKLGQKLSDQYFFKIMKSKSRWNNFYLDDHPDEAFAESFAYKLNSPESQAELRQNHLDLDLYFDQLLQSKMGETDPDLNLKLLAKKIQDIFIGLKHRSGLDTNASEALFSSTVFVRPQEGRKLLGFFGKQQVVIQLEPAVSAVQFAIGKIDKIDATGIQIIRKKEYEQDVDYLFHYEWAEIVSLGFPHEFVNSTMKRMEEMNSSNPVKAISARTFFYKHLNPEHYENVLWFERSEGLKIINKVKPNNFLVSIELPEDSNGLKYVTGTISSLNNDTLALYVNNGSNSHFGILKEYKISDIKSFGIPRVVAGSQAGLFKARKSEKEVKDLIAENPSVDELVGIYEKASRIEDIKEKLDYGFKDFSPGQTLIVEYLDQKTSRRQFKAGLLVYDKDSYGSEWIDKIFSFQQYRAPDTQSSAFGKYSIPAESKILSAYLMHPSQPVKADHYTPRSSEWVRERLVKDLTTIDAEKTGPLFVYFRYDLNYHPSRGADKDSFSVSGVLKSVSSDSARNATVVVTNLSGQDVVLDMSKVYEVHFMYSMDPEFIPFLDFKK